MTNKSYWQKFGRKVALIGGGMKCYYCEARVLRGDTVHQMITHLHIIRDLGMIPHIICKELERSLRMRIATIDHVIPISKGGSETDLDNMVVACHRCNTWKGSADWSRFINKKGSMKGHDHGDL